jgi:hypothetical protein
MRLEQALDEFGVMERRRKRGEEGRGAALALAALREYLLEYSGHEGSADVTPRDLNAFLLDYYPSEESPDPDVALSLLDTTAAFARWLLERGERGLAPFVAAEDALREDLPRVLTAFAALEEHTQRDRLGPPLLAELPTNRNSHEPGHPEDAPDEPDDPPTQGNELLGELGSGLDRMVRLDEVDYPDAEEDYYTITEVREDGFTASSPTREALGQPAAVVRVPLPTGLLRPGDIIHAEIAPATGGREPGGWELLNVFGIRPGGYA